MGVITKANIQIVSDGTLPGTHVYFIDEDESHHEVIPVTSIEYKFSSFDTTPTVKLGIVFPQLEALVSADVVEFIHGAIVQE